MSLFFKKTVNKFLTVLVPFSHGIIKNKIQNFTKETQNIILNNLTNKKSLYIFHSFLRVLLLLFYLP